MGLGFGAPGKRSQGRVWGLDSIRILYGCDKGLSAVLSPDPSKSGFLGCCRVSWVV